jgi:hypothetical protein
MPKKRPKLRTVEKHQPPYPLNNFPETFPIDLGREIIFLLATKQTASLEGEDWEAIFAKCINAQWKPSNVGLDDVLLKQTAWSAKSVKHKKPANCETVRLISGRNSPAYSFGVDEILKQNPRNLGEMVLDIWNERVAAVKKNYQLLRTVVLIKSDDLLELAVFEFNTEMYDPNSYDWSWNKNKNLIGTSKNTGNHSFTWQPHGSQFTIIEEVPNSKLAIRLKQPLALDRDSVLRAIGFDDSWVQVLTRQ